MEWTNFIEPVLKANRSSAIPLYGSWGITTYVPFRVLRQLGRIQGVPPDVTVEPITPFDQGIPPIPLPRRAQILEAWSTIQTDHSLPFDSLNPVIAQTTAEYDEWIRRHQVQYVPVDPLEENKQLRAQLQAKDAELQQEKLTSARYRQELEKLQAAYDRAQEGIRDRKRQCIRITEEVDSALRGDFRETIRSRAQRYEDQTDKMLTHLRDLAK